jgi:hypothetical protein
MSLLDMQKYSMLGLGKRQECCQYNQRSSRQGAIQWSWLLPIPTQRRTGDGQRFGASSHAISIGGAVRNNVALLGAPVLCTAVSCRQLAKYLQASE